MDFEGAVGCEVVGERFFPEDGTQEKVEFVDLGGGEGREGDGCCGDRLCEVSACHLFSGGEMYGVKVAVAFTSEL
jgi:hypothetical protein